MKFVILFIVGVAVAAGIGAGAVHMLQPVSDEPDYTAMIAENSAKRAAMASALDKSFYNLNDRLDSLSGDLLAVSERIEGLEKEVRELGKMSARQEPGSRGESETVEATPSGIEELVGKVIKEREEERQKERQEQRAERMSGMADMMQGIFNTQIDEFAKKKNWNIAKQEEVKGIVKGSMEKMTEIFKDFRMDGPPSAETMQKMREIMQETETKLKEVMTEEEWKEFQENMPGPGMFGPRGMGGRRGGGGQQPGGEEGR